MLKRPLIKILIILAVIGILSGAIMVYISELKPVTPKIPLQPPKPPFAHYIAASGEIDPLTGLIYIGTPVTEIVSMVYLVPGTTVEKGAPLFSLQTDTIDKQIAEAQRNYDITLASYQKSLALPRPEEVPPLEAEVGEKSAAFEDALLRYELYQQVCNPHAISIDEYNTKKYAYLQSKFALEHAEKNLALLKAGAWEKDLAIHLAELKSKQASLEILETNKERYTIRAPMRGTLLQTNTAIGELANAGTNIPPLMVFGYIDVVELYVYVDEEEVWRVQPNAAARAYVRGNSAIEIPLNFARIEPYLVNKRMLSGENTETIDTRVLPVVYQFERKDYPVYPGELVDVYMEAKPQP